jgi:dTDP-4-dehydrorhamnose reductase
VREQTGDIADGARAFRGVYHFSSEGSTSWCGFARAILDAVPDTERRAVAVRAITTDEYPTPARRPANSCLDTSRIRETFGLSALSWREELERVTASSRSAERELVGARNSA